MADSPASPSKAQSVIESPREVTRQKQRQDVIESKAEASSQSRVSRYLGSVIPPFTARENARQPVYSASQKEATSEEHQGVFRNISQPSAVIDISDRDNPGETKEHPQKVVRDAELDRMIELRDNKSAKLEAVQDDLRRCKLYVQEQGFKYRERLRQITSEKAKLEDILTSLQEKALNSMVSSSTWVPKEDQLVRDEFYKLEIKMRTWARANSVMSMSDLVGHSDRRGNMIVDQLGIYSGQKDWKSLIERMPTSPFKVPALIVQALLAKHVFEMVFSDPFFAFSNLEDELNIPKPVEMQSMYRAMIRCNQKEAHAWRSQTLRLLWPAADPASRNELQHRLGSIAKQNAKNFFGSPVASLLRPVESSEAAIKCLNALETLYSSATELAFSLWTQRIFMVCKSQGDLPIFNATSSVMSAHRLHKLDEDDTRLDGKKVLLVVQPAVLAFGDENGESYDQSKVWARANVLVDES